MSQEEGDREAKREKVVWMEVGQGCVEASVEGSKKGAEMNGAGRGKSLGVARQTTAAGHKKLVGRHRGT